MPKTPPDAEGGGGAGGAIPASRFVVFGTIAGLGCLIDLLSKHWVFAWKGLAQGPVRDIEWIVPGYFGVETTLNRGALFGLGQGWVPLFGILSVAAIVGIVYWLFFAGGAHDWWLTLALSCVMAGVLGNLYDRLGLWTPPWAPETQIFAVRDWILLEYDGRTWPNFNIADTLLVTGAILLAVVAFRAKDDAAEETPPAKPIDK